MSEDLPHLVTRWTVRKINHLTGWYDGDPLYTMVFDTCQLARVGIIMRFGFEDKDKYEPYPVQYKPVKGKLVRFA